MCKDNVGLVKVYEISDLSSVDVILSSPILGLLQAKFIHSKLQGLSMGYHHK